MKKKKSPFLVIFLFLLCIAALAVGAYAYKRYMPTKEKADLTELYDGKDNEVTIFLNYEKQTVRGIYADGQTYLPIQWLNDNLNERFYWDSNEKQLIYALPDHIVYADENSEGTSGKKILMNTEDGVYLTLGLILNYTDVRIHAYDNDIFKRVYVENTWNGIPTATVKHGGKLRLRGGVKSPIITDIIKDDSVVVLETMDNWTKVMTKDGHIGYMSNRKIKDLREETPVSTFEAPVYKNISLDKKINMVWHQVTIEAANRSLEELLSTSQGVNVIAPTWFSLSDNDGNYESLASKSYVDKAHAMGIQVWAVLDNFSRECSQNVQSEKLFAKTAARKKLISKLMKEADTYGFDGINLDFESLQEAAGVHYVQFIRELSVSCREKGIILSVDNYVPAAYNKFYNRKEQGIVADYVIIMGYDEHYAGGDPGSVASLGYVEKGIKDTVDIVPKEKVINGVPFYTRLWTQKGDKITSKAMGIFSAKQWISDNNVELIWEEEIGQYYGEAQTADGFSYLWMEDAKSLGLKMDLIKKYDLAGVSGWKLGLETQDMWDVFGWR
ncbi:MAG: glycosyl hydrolase family 18 protein [Clostridium sp.]